MRITSHPLRGPAATAAVRKSPALDRQTPLHLRLLEPADAAFVDSFRAPTAAHLDIPHYKLHEAAGREFCFVIVGGGQDRGLVRMHDFAEIDTEPSFSWGNWVARQPNSPGLLAATARLIYGLGFDTLGFARAHLAVPKSNPDLVAFHFETGADLEHDDGSHLYLRIGPPAYDRLRAETPEPRLALA